MSIEMPDLNSTKIKTVATVITPTMAIKWLEGNVHNRSISTKTVNAFARDMLLGHWLITHQGIAFAKDGTLIDGQHRLWAVVESKKSVLMNVTTGLDLKTQDAIDIGRNRSVRDIIALQRKSNKQDGKEPKRIRSVHVGIARMLCEQTGIMRPTTPEQIEVYGKFEPAILAAIDMYPRIVPRLQNASIGCVITRAILAGENKDKIARFVYILTEGMPGEGSTLTETDRMVITLRRLLTDSNPSRNDVYHKTERVLRAYLDDERMTNIYAASVELFRIPGEKPLTTKELGGLTPSQRRKRGAQLPYNKFTPNANKKGTKSYASYIDGARPA
jgi:hypothetical protein